MQKPNVLLLDEPTNDLDIVTLNILEEYLLEYKGTLIIVTHDRHFMDRLVDHIFVFCGDGEIKDFIGGYTEYRSFIKDYEMSKKATEMKPKEVQKPRYVAPSQGQPVARKLSFKEKRELEELDAKIEKLTKENSELETLLAAGTSDLETLTKASVRYGEVKDELDIAELRWLELSE